MKSFIPISGSGKFVLRVNELVALEVTFNEETSEALVFNLKQFIEDDTIGLFQANSDLTFSLSIEDFVPNAANEDIKLQYSFLL